MVKRTKTAAVPVPDEVNRKLLTYSKHDAEQRHLTTTSRDNFISYMLHRYEQDYPEVMQVQEET